MADERLRRAERDWRAGDDPQAEAALVRLRLQAGTLAPDDAELLAYLGRPGARLALELAPDDDRLPRRLFRAGAGVPLATAARDRLGPSVAIRARAIDDALTFGVEVDGALRGAAQAAFGIVLDELVAMGVERLIVDARGMTYIGSSGLGSLVRGADELQKRGGRLDLIGVTQTPRVVIEMLGLTSYFGLYDSTEEALQRPRPPLGATEPQDPDRAWLLRVARWGPEPCVRAALTLAAPGPRLPAFHPLGSGGLRDPSVVTGDPAAAAAARAWLACPCAAHRAEAGRAAVKVSEGGWPGVAAATVERGPWLKLPPGPYDRAAVALALAEHLLGPKADGKR